jgi:uncharacterized protein YjbI with pentapeptide repeats
LGLLRDDLFRDALLLVIGIVAAWWIANRQDKLASDLETASEIQENIRFVRQVAINDSALKPFRGLNLSDAELAGLNLGCDNAAAHTGCADLWGANLGHANLAGANLTGANMVGANLTGAFLAGANLTGADLTSADLTNAVIVLANLTGANLTAADLGQVQAVCYDNTTKWPDGFTPPPSNCNY